MLALGVVATAVVAVKPVLAIGTTESRCGADFANVIAGARESIGTAGSRKVRVGVRRMTRTRLKDSKRP